MTYRSHSFAEQHPNLSVSAPEEGTKVAALAVPLPRKNILNNYFHVRMHEECVQILHLKSTLCEGIKVVIVLHQ